MSEKKGIMTQVRRAVTRIDVILNDIMDRLDDEVEPLTISIMGQTRVGKSSLMNALLGTDSPVDPISPGTIGLREHEMNSESGHKVRFYDLPGLGESQRKDEEYIQRYRSILQKSDVALWAVLADSRSFVYDHDALEKILDMPSHQEQLKLMDKIVFVLTKVDLLTDPHHYAPWTLTRLADNQGIFETHTYF